MAVYSKETEDGPCELGMRALIFLHCSPLVGTSRMHSIHNKELWYKGLLLVLSPQ